MAEAIPLIRPASQGTFSRKGRRTALSVLAVLAGIASAQAQVTRYEIIGDAIPAPLDGLTGDPARGRQIVVTRQKGLCLLCHSGPFPEERFQGDLSPSLAGAGSRSTEGQLRLRLVDSTKVNPASIMPAYHRTTEFSRVGRAFADKPILTAQEIEDVVAFLMELKQ
jgi:L-cysteine S-thiosulfotransferase